MQGDFDIALSEIKPAFGKNEVVLNSLSSSLF